MARLPEGAERSLWGSGDVCREDPEIPQRPFYRDLCLFALRIAPQESGSIVEIFPCLRRANRWLPYGRDFELPSPLFFCCAQAGCGIVLRSP
jgi:hypothetical protein